MKDLQGLINECRSNLDEPGEKFWSDLELTGWLNEGLAMLTRAAQVIKIPVRISFPASNGEIPLKVEPTDVMSVKLFVNGQVYKLKNVDDEIADDLQTGARQQATIPQLYYLRWYSPLLQYQDATNDVSISPASTQDNDFRCILGVHPIPTGAVTGVVNCMVSHPELVKNSDRVIMPYPFQRGAVHWASGLALKKEKFLEEAAQEFEIFNDISDKLKEYMSQANNTGHARMKDKYDDDTDHNWDDRVILE